MKHHEQLDALAFAIDNIIGETQLSLDDTELTETVDDILADFLKKLNYHINHHLEEFDINLFEVIGIIEDTKFINLVDGPGSASIIGCLDAQKMALLTTNELSFEEDDELDIEEESEGWDEE
tara:strand:- start:435 stop:800 length:366 start_codon:yes stop_codon:yes gene_type:complete